MVDHRGRIEINGKFYDAKTGNLISHSPTKKAQNIKHTVKTRKHLTIDGVVRHSPASHHTAKKHHTPHHKPNDHKKHEAKKVHVESSAKADHKETTDRLHSPVNVRHHKPQHSATLVRRLVQRPGPKDSTLSRKFGNAVIAGDKQGRLQRAKTIQKSQHISRFPSANQPHHMPKPSYAKLPVQSPPTEQTKAHPAKPAEHKPHSHPQTHSNAHTHKTPAKTKQEEIFEKAMQASKSHQSIGRHKQPRRRMYNKLGMKRKTFNTATATLAVLLFTGFFMYQNIPNFSMRIASNRAGFDASLPSYNPSGFAMGGPIEYSPGKVTVNFKSNTDNRNYALTQKVSNWNSQALVDNYIDAQGKKYQTFQEKGKTIFVFDESSATWVSGGVWYQVEGNSALNTDQLLRIASSI